MVHISQSGKEALDAILNKAVEENKLHGVQFAASNLDGEIYSGAAGLRVLDDPSSGKVDEDTNFWICSQTKLVVSIALLQLIEKGKVTLDTPASSIIPELSNPVIVENPYAEESPYHPAKNIITVKHLLNHSSGLFYTFTRAIPYSLPPPYTDTAEEGDAVAYLFKILKGNLPGVPVMFEPGTSFSYGYGVDMAGFIVERITGKTLEEYCQENIFKPIGTKTTFYRTPEMKEKSMGLTFRKPDGSVVKFWGEFPLTEQDAGKVRIHLGGIGLQSTLKDYLTLLRHLLQIHAGRAQNPILTPQTVHTLFEPSLSSEGVKALTLVVQRPDYQFGYGLCVNTQETPGMRKKGSGFWGGWAGTLYFLDPTTGVAAVYGTHVIPYPDVIGLTVFTRLEAALYAALSEQRLVKI